MNDSQLIELVQQKTPQELSLREIELLRARLTDSPRLCRALVEQLRLESYLAEALGRIDVPVEQIIARARRRRWFNGSTMISLLGMIAGLGLIGFVVAVFVMALVIPAGQPIDGTAVARPALPDHETGYIEPGDDAPTANVVDSSDLGDFVPGNAPPPAVADGATGTAEVLPLTIEAEKFVRGDVAIDSTDWGSKEVTVIVSGTSGGFVEYEFVLRDAGRYQLNLRYASFDSRPLRLTINDQAAAGQVAGRQTGGSLPDAQKWFSAGEFAFVAGKNMLRLETSAQFPHLDRLVIADPAVGGNFPANAAPHDRPPSVAQQRQPAPWQQVMSVAGPLPRFEEVCFDRFPTDKSLPRRDELHRWFAPVEGAPYRVTNIRSPRGECGLLNGLARLKSPWTDDSALRLSLEDYDRLKIHFFHGTRGVTLVYYQQENYRWAAYATTRKPTAAQPDTLALTADDSLRNRRTEIRFGGPFEIRHRDGEIVLSRGDVVLLRAPLEEPPEQVFFDGRAVFYGIGLVRTRDFPSRAGPLPLAHDIQQPATLDWDEQVHDGAKFQKLADGSVRLTVGRSDSAGWATAPLPEGGLHLIVLRVEDATPGSGLFLAGPQGQPRHVLRFVHNRSGGGTCLAMHAQENIHHDQLGACEHRLVPVVGKTLWICLLQGCGMVRWWMSSDGVHWAEPTGPTVVPPAAATRIGLHHVAGVQDCSITLRRVSLRRLDPITSLVAADLLNRATPHSNSPRLEDWLSSVGNSQPDDVDLSAWRRACAVAALGGGCSRDLGLALVELLLDDAQSRRATPRQRLRFLQQAVLLLDTYNDSALLARVVALYRQLGWQAFDASNERPFSLVRHPLMTAPLALKHNLRVADEAAIRAELVQLLSAGQWRDTLEFGRRLRFFGQHQQLPLVEWAEATARRELPSVAGQTPMAQHRASWRHPLEEEFNKQTYNTVAELEAVLASDAFEDAVEMISASEPSALEGVAPHARDRQLLVSLPTAIRLALGHYPQLKTVMNRQWGEIAQLRIRRAIAQADVEALELACVQFETTEAAARAHRWLGDRALSDGWFAQALFHYRRAQRTADAVDQPQLAACIRLAAAMLGQDEGHPPTAEVQLGQSRMSAEEFEGLVAEMRSRAASLATVTPGSQSGAQHFAAPPSPSGFRVESRARFAGALGRQPETELTRHVRGYNVDWVGRQLTAVVEGDLLYAANRFQVTAYDLAEGKQQWQSTSPSAAMMHAQDWVLTPMRPLLTSQHIYVRQLYGQGPILVCLDKRSGEMVWHAGQRGGEFLVSDPVMIQGRLLALTLMRTDQRISLLRLATFDADTGEILTQHDLLRLRDVWWSRRVCMVSTADNAIFASLGGLTLCCEATGKVRWIRKQITLPNEEDPSWVRQYYEAPLVHDEKLLVAQPGVRSIECLDGDSGAQYWSAVVPGLQRILGVARQRVIVQTEAGLRALDLTSGKTLWKHRASGMLVGQLCGGPGGVLYSRRVPGPGDRKRFIARLVWLDPASGAERAAVDLPKLIDAQPRLGPLLLHRDHLWAFFGRGQDSPTRDLVELIPTGAAAAANRPAVPSALVNHPRRNRKP